MAMTQEHDMDVADSKRNGRVCSEGIGMWTEEEHDRFMVAMNMYPNGPWRLVADYVGTRNARQTMTHAQKYKQKLARRQRGLRTPGRTPTRRQRQASISESDSGSDTQEPARDIRPHLPVVVRARRHEMQRDSNGNVTQQSFLGSFQALHQAHVQDMLTDLDEDIPDSLFDSEWLTPLHFVGSSSPRDPCERAEDDGMWIDEYVNLMLPLESVFT